MDQHTSSMHTSSFRTVKLERFSLLDPVPSSLSLSESIVTLFDLVFSSFVPYKISNINHRIIYDNDNTWMNSEKLALEKKKDSWLITLDSLLLTLDMWYAIRTTSSSPIYRSSFIIHRPSFIVHRSSFIVHRSSFIVHRSSFIVHRSSLIVHPSFLTLRP